MFLVSTTLLGFFKSEKAEETEIPSIKETYVSVFKILKLKNVQMYALIIFTSQIGTAVSGTLGLKLVEKGFGRDTQALMGVPITFIGVFFPIILAKVAIGKNILKTWAFTYIPCYCNLAMYGLLVYLIQESVKNTGEITIGLYIFAAAGWLFSDFFGKLNYSVTMAFRARVSDPEIGGTYTTLLNTIGNTSHKVCDFVAMFIVDKISRFACTFDEQEFSKNETNWNDKKLQNQCKQLNGTFTTEYDGVYIETGFCVLFGLIWLSVAWKTILKLDSIPVESWHVKKADPEVDAVLLSAKK